MSPTANERLLNSTIRHRVDVQKYGNHVIKQVLSLMQRSEDDLVTILAKRTKENWTTRRLKVILAESRAIIQDNSKKITKTLTQEMTEFAQVSAKDAADGLVKAEPEVQAVFGITQPSAQQLAAMVSEVPITVGPDGKLLLEEIFEGLAAGRVTKIKQAVRLGMAEGETIEEVVRRLVGTRANKFKDGIFEGNRRGARAMVRTIVNHVSNQAAAMTYKENEDIIKGEQWTSTLDNRTTLICMSRDGKIYPVGEGPRPPAHVNCRSFMVPVLKSWEELGIDAKELPPSTRASMDGQVPEDMTYEQWLRKNPQYAEEALGKTRAKLFLENKISIDRFVSDDGRTLTLQELKNKGIKGIADI